MRGKCERKKKRCEMCWRVAECHSKLGGEDKQQPEEPAKQYTSKTVLSYRVKSNLSVSNRGSTYGMVCWHSYSELKGEVLRPRALAGFLGCLWSLQTAVLGFWCVGKGRS